MRFVALGDSLTVGLCDPAPGGWRGWARLLADSLDGAQLHNLARCGARAHDVATDRLAQALAARPSLASVVVAVNDTLRGDFSLGQTARDVAYAAAALTQAGAIVLTARLPEPGAMLGLPDVVRRPLARRTHALNAVLDDLGSSVRHRPPRHRRPRTRTRPRHVGHRPAAPERTGPPHARTYVR